jgi:hypothetical protein
MSLTHISRRAIVLATPAILLTAGQPMPASARSASARTTAFVTGRPSLIMRAGREFAASCHVHLPLPDATVKLPLSDAFVRDLVRQVASLGTAVNIDQYSPPLYVVGHDVPVMRVKAARSSDPRWSFGPLQTQWNDVPRPEGFQPSAGTDKDAIIYQPDTGRYFEFWGLEPSQAADTRSQATQLPLWQAAWGGRIDNLANSPGYFPPTRDGHKFGVAATSLALLAGLMTVAEQQAGEINHVLHVALPETRRSVWVHPAQRTDGAVDRPDAIPQGTLFRLPSDLDLNSLRLDPFNRMIARAVQRHGMVVRDTAGVVAFYAENPLSTTPDTHPYFGAGGILRCPEGRAIPACYPDGNNRLAGFPWERLEAVRTEADP